MGLGETHPSAQVVLAFASPSTLDRRAPLAELKRMYPIAQILVCSTAGEILDTQVLDERIVATALSFEHTRVESWSLTPTEATNSHEAGCLLAQRLHHSDLSHVLVFTDGIHVNGSSLVRGLVENLDDDVSVSGGLAGDGERFGETHVFLGTEPRRELVVGLGFYGSRIRIGQGCLGGWDPFGPERLITRSEANVLHELDGRSALELYKRYLGDYAQELPASALLFPLMLRSSGDAPGLVRTVLAIDEERQTMTFAGDMPEGQHARLMRANFERLIDGATGAAKTTLDTGSNAAPDFALLISCVGRRMVLKQRVEEEVESVREIFGGNTVMAGFYSYGELSSDGLSGSCELHNQTMSITAFSES